MDYWQEFQQKWLGYVPLFLLTLGCGIESGRLMAVAFLRIFSQGSKIRQLFFLANQKMTKESHCHILEP